jgi:hypothetical protein
MNNVKFESEAWITFSAYGLFYIGRTKIIDGAEFIIALNEDGESVQIPFFLADNPKKINFLNRQKIDSIKDEKKEDLTLIGDKINNSKTSSKDKQIDFNRYSIFQINLN